jgi:glycosyltransferase involved in cell wall biosynthesis
MITTIPSISFLVFVHNEGRELAALLSKLRPWLDSHIEDELVIVDDFSTDIETKEALRTSGAKVVQHALNGDFSAHKNFGNGQCSKNWICQYDADEYPTESLLENLKELIQMNPNVELYRLPRVNLVRGLTPEHAQKWGWRVYWLDAYPNIPCVNQNDNQGRLYKNEPGRIKWVRSVHEVIVGHNVVATIPFDPEFALIHDKTIARQEKQNEFYRKNWKV